MKTVLGGEGSTELGDWAHCPSYRSSPPQVGVLDTLIDRIRRPYLETVHGIPWTKIRKLRPGGHRSAERRNVLGLVDMARQMGAAAVVFSRDRDGDPDREKEITEALNEAGALYPEMRVAGGVAREETEAWLLAMKGDPESESHPDPKRLLEERYAIKTTDEKVAVIRGADLAHLPHEARSLHEWIDAVRLL